MRALSHARSRVAQLLFLSVPLASAASGQDLAVRNYTEHEGLPASAVRDVRQAPDGRIWFASRRGVHVYDGTSWQDVLIDGSMPVRFAKAVRFDRGNQAWVVESDGDVFRGSAEGVQVVQQWPKELLGDVHVEDVALATTVTDSTLAIVTFTGRLYVRNGEGTWRRMTEHHAIQGPVRVVHAIDDRLYVGTDQGLLVRDGERFRSALPDDVALPGPAIHGLASVSTPAGETLWIKGYSWVATLTNGDVDILATGIPVPIQLSDAPTPIAPDGHGGVLYGSRSELFHVDSDGSAQSLGRGNGFVADGVNSLYRDVEGSVWAGTPEGAWKLPSLRIATWKAKHGLLRDEVSALLRLRDGRIVLGHNNGITLHTDNLKSVRLLSGGSGTHSDTRILDLDEDDEGNVWIAGSALGVIRFKDGDLQSFPVPVEAKSWANAVHVDTNGDVWVGTPRGLYHLEEGELRAARNDPTRRRYVRRVEEGPDGTLYVARVDGLWVKRGGKWSHVVAETEGASNNLFAVFPETDGHVWVGSDDGLWVLDGTRLRRPRHGLSIERPVYVMLRDERDRLWVGTDYGVYCWDGDRLEHLALADGLAGHETNRAAKLIDENGDVWIGTDRGVSVFRARYERPVAPTTVELLDAQLGGAAIDLDDMVKADGRHGDLVLRARALSFVDESRIHFRSRVVGYESEWRVTEGSTVLEARYTALNPGQYRFEVQARNASSVWGPIARSDTFRVVGPFWTRGWFYLLAILATSTTVYGALRFLYAKKYARRLEGEVRERTLELKRSQEELARAERVRSLGLLAGGIAHDFNNVLTALMGNLSLLRTQVKLDAGGIACLDEADRAADRASQLASQLLTFSKGGAPVRRAVTLDAMVRDTAQFALSGSNIRCEIELQDDLWAAEVDPAQIHQVIENLLINARQAMQRGGTLFIRAENLEVTEPELEELTPGRYVRLSVADEGTGIPRELLVRIFEPFFSTKPDGHGLGLATARSVLERHGGSIRVQSAPGSGTTFTLYIPASTGTAEKLPSTLVEVRGGHGRVLVLDDEQAIRDLLTGMLKELGYEVEVVASGDGAVDAVRGARLAGRPFDFAILDLTLPGDDDGATILRRLLAVEPDLAAVASSGYAEDRVLAHFADFGFKAALPKPYRLADLAEALNRLSPAPV